MKIRLRRKNLIMFFSRDYFPALLVLGFMIKHQKHVQAQTRDILESSFHEKKKHISGFAINDILTLKLILENKKQS